MRKPKVVIIGAGSLTFSMACIKDVFHDRDLWGSELVLVDIDQIALELMYKLALRFNETTGANFKILCDTDRCKALPGADFVVVSVAVERFKLWKLDFEIPKKYGIMHILGENGGPGAVFHTMRRY